MKKKLKEYILKNYEDGDYYWKIYGEDKDRYKVSAIDRIGLDDHHFKGRGVYGVWEKIPVDLENKKKLKEYAVAYRLYEIQDAVFEDWLEDHKLEDEPIEDDITHIYHKNFYIRSPLTQRDFDWWDEKCYIVEGVFDSDLDPEEWIKENPNREGELNELAYNSVIQQMLDNWSLLTYEYDEYVVCGKFEKGDLVMLNNEPLIAIPTKTDMSFYSPKGKSYVLNIPIETKKAKWFFV